MPHTNAHPDRPIEPVLETPRLGYRLFHLYAPHRPPGELRGRPMRPRLAPADTFEWRVRRAQRQGLFPASHLPPPAGPAREDAPPYVTLYDLAPASAQRPLGRIPGRAIFLTAAPSTTG